MLNLDFLSAAVVDFGPVRASEMWGFQQTSTSALILNGLQADIYQWLSQSGRPALGAGGPQFESERPDQYKFSGIKQMRRISFGAFCVQAC